MRREDLVRDSTTGTGREHRTATTRTEVLDLHPVYFLSGRSSLGPHGRALLARAVRVLTSHPAMRLEVSGYADSTGSRAFNLWLSNERAIAVRRYLVDLGVTPERLVAVGRGPDQPAASNSTAAGRAANRRVQLQPLE